MGGYQFKLICFQRGGVGGWTGGAAQVWSSAVMPRQRKQASQDASSSVGVL